MIGGVTYPGVDPQAQGMGGIMGPGGPGEHVEILGDLEHGDYH